MRTIILLILWIPAVGTIIYSVGWYTINIVLLITAIYLGKYLWSNNPFTDNVLSEEDQFVNQRKQLH